MAVRFTTVLKKFASKGEKTGWTYISLPAKTASLLKPGSKVSFRVRGKIDEHEISGVATIPMGDGDFIIAVNATMRNALRKQAGAKVSVDLEIDNVPFVINEELLACLDDEPVAKKYFDSLAASHQRYFSKWIDSAKTPATKIKRIAKCVNALARKMNYAEMLREKAN